MRVSRALVTVATTAVCALGAQLGVPAQAGTLLGVPAQAGTLQVVSGARVAAVADPIAHRLVAEPDRALAPAFAIADQQLPPGEVALAPSGTPFVSSTYVGVPVAIRVDGKLARTVMAGYRVTTYVHTAVAARDLAPGALLSADDVMLARVAASGRPAVGTAVLVGRKLRAATAKGAPLYAEQTVANDVVKPGQPAILVVHDGSVALAADVVARTGGALGDVVTVFNPQTQKALAGIVTGPNRVEITLPGGER
ncbi:MAG: Chaperone for flagella basal body P-ring formation [Candidatus Eremiobacteraeota bacterium]|jgi:flagella basal body P-ring formation protein FlgA|nr:Chaperone for flagella basal body P-ring formation [Candidatus Eremiobacteraeota bacterium]